MKVSPRVKLPAFTLIELLVVISILGIMAALTVPVLKNFAQSDSTLGASRQLLDGVARARQLAVSHHTTVYMIFVPVDFWNYTNGTWPNGWWTSLTPAQQTAVSNLCDKQLTGYNFVSLRPAGNQPGQATPRYLDQWQTLPDGMFVAVTKFTELPSQFYPVIDPVSGAVFDIYGFNNPPIPFPTADAPPVPMPCVAFNYLGQLTDDGQAVAGADEYLPLAKGSVIYAKDAATKTFKFNSPDVLESPPGNSIDSSYNIVHIERLTGRAFLEFQKINH